MGNRDQTDLLITLEYGYESFPSFSVFTREEQVDRTFNQEFRLVSKNDGPLNWIGGLFYNRLRSSGATSEFTPHYDEFLAGGDPSVPLRPDALEFFAVSKADLNESALYGEVGYQITDQWQVTVGGKPNVQRCSIAVNTMASCSRPRGCHSAARRSTDTTRVSPSSLSACRAPAPRSSSRSWPLIHRCLQPAS